MSASAQSFMLQTQELSDELRRDTGAKQHSNDHRIQEILDLCHATITVSE